jgi:uncharacterized membrane protein YfcA
MKTNTNDNRQASKKSFNRKSIFPIAIFLILWIIYMFDTGQWSLFIDNWFMSVTMIFGSFIAGASAEGGGAIAFPVMTLIFDIMPYTARNFSLAIQSVGMTAAAIIILRNKYPVEFRYLIPASIGGGIGIIFGTFVIVPLVPSPYVKMLFVTLWLSFGIILFYINRIDKREVFSNLPELSKIELALLLFVGFSGGNLSAILGSGLDIFSFAYITVRYHLSEKVATPTSVVIMAINSLIGFSLHYFVIQDFAAEEFNYWMVSIPVVLIGAPLGAYYINRQTRDFVSWLLYIIITAQFVGALVIIKPGGGLLIFSIAVFVFGLVFFYVFTRCSLLIKKEPELTKEKS